MFSASASNLANQNTASNNVTNQNNPPKMNSKQLSITLTSLAALLFLVSFFVPYYSLKSYDVLDKKIELKSGIGISWADGQFYRRDDLTKNEWNSDSMRRIDKVYMLRRQIEEMEDIGKTDEANKLRTERDELAKTLKVTGSDSYYPYYLSPIQLNVTTPLSITFFLGLIAAIVFQAMNGKISMARDVTIFIYAITLFIGTSLLVVATISSSYESLYWYPNSIGRDHGYYLLFSSLIMTLISFVINGLSYVKDQQGKQ